MTAARAAANERSIWVERYPTTALVEAELAIGGELDHDRAQHCIVRRCQRCERQCPQPRDEVGNSDRPGRRRRARGKQQVGVLLTREIDEMKQRAFIRRNCGVLHDQRARCQRGRDFGGGERMSRK